MSQQRAQEQLDAQVTRTEAFLAAIGYISFLCILPLVLLRESSFAQFHGKQALVLAIVIYFLDILEIFPATLAFAYTILKTVIVVVAIVQSFRGRRFRIPLIYGLSERFSINMSPASQPSASPSS